MTTRNSVYPMTCAAFVLAASLALFATPIQAQDLSTERPTLPAKAVLLDWRKVPWPPLSYERVPLGGGAGLYVVRSDETLKFRMTLIFAHGVYSLEQKQRPTLGAFVDLLVEGGTKDRSFEALQQLTQENGLSLRNQVSGTGAVVVTLEGLSKDYDMGLTILRDVLLAPAFRPSAFETWQRNKTAEFQGLMDAKSIGDQMRLIEPFVVRQLFGPNHYFATFLERSRPTTLAQIKLDEVRALQSQILNKRGLLAMLAGRLTPKQIKAAGQLIERLPQGKAGSGLVRWLPDRGLLPPSEKATITVLQKPDMPQSTMLGRVHMRDVGTLNPLEETALAIARDVFSSSAGVVGEDRFSAALRKRSGLSYSAHAAFDANTTAPNTGTATWNMVFQTPEDRTAEGINLAWQTWQEFRTKGIQQDEFERSRIVLMNQMLSSENPILQKAAQMLQQLAVDRVPSTTPDESTLARLEAMQSAAEVNAVLQRMTHPSRTRVTFAVIGGASEATIKALRKLPFVEKVDVVAYDALKKDLL